MTERAEQNQPNIFNLLQGAHGVLWERARAKGGDLHEQLFDPLVSGKEEEVERIQEEIKKRTAPIGAVIRILDDAINRLKSELEAGTVVYEDLELPARVFAPTILDIIKARIEEAEIEKLPVPEGVLPKEVAEPETQTPTPESIEKEEPPTIIFDPDQLILAFGDRRMKVSPRWREKRLPALEILSENQGRFLPRKEFMQAGKARGIDFGKATNVTQLMARTQRQIEELSGDSNLLEIVRGKGYRLGAGFEVETLSEEAEKSLDAVYDRGRKTLAVGSRSMVVKRQRGLAPRVEKLLTTMATLGQRPLTAAEIAEASGISEKQIKNVIYNLRQVTEEGFPDLIETTDEGTYRLTVQSFTIIPSPEEIERARLEKAGQVFMIGEVMEATGLDKNSIARWRQTDLLERETHCLALERGQKTQWRFTEAGIQRLKLLKALRDRADRIINYKELKRLLDEQILQAVSPSEAAEIVCQRTTKKTLNANKIRVLSRFAEEDPRAAAGVWEEGVHYFSSKTSDGKTIRQINSLGLESLETAARNWKDRVGPAKILRSMRTAQKAKPETPPEFKPDEVDFTDDEIYMLTSLMIQACERAEQETKGIVEGVNVRNLLLAEALEGYQEQKKAGLTIADCELVRKSLEQKLEACLKDPIAVLNRLTTMEKDEIKYEPALTLLFTLDDVDYERRERFIQIILTPARSVVLKESRFGRSLEPVQNSND